MKNFAALTSNEAIEHIDLKVLQLLKHRDSFEVKKNPRLRSSICTVIAKAYFLQYLILSERKLKEASDDQFFTASEAVNRHFRDCGLDAVADIYNELRATAVPFLEA